MKTVTRKNKTFIIIIIIIFFLDFFDSCVSWPTTKFADFYCHCKITQSPYAPTMYHPFPPNNIISSH